MPLFKKKIKEEDKLELPELPSFSEMDAVKQAVEPGMKPSMARGTLPELPQTFEKQHEMEMSSMPAEYPAFSAKRTASEPEQKPEERHAPLTQEITASPTSFMPSHERYDVSTSTQMLPRAGRKETKPREPIFIKIDNFKDALSNFELIKERLIEIDELLKKLKETRIKEQDEFDSWEKEVIEIKSRVDEIDEKLFSNIE